MRAGVLLASLLVSCVSKPSDSCATSDDCNPGRVCKANACYPSDDVCGEAGCQLLSVSPMLLSAGEVMSLEGTFAPKTTVVFPGGVAIAPDVADPHRLSVTLPDGVASGPVYVVNTVLGVDQPTRAISFRRLVNAPTLASAPHIQTSWALAEPTVKARPGAATVVVGESAGGAPPTAYMPTSAYALGGFDSDGVTPLRDGDAWRIDAHGALSDFAASPPMLATPRAFAAVATTLTSAYLVGGVGAAGASVERAPILDDGTLGGFTSLDASPLMPARSNASAVVVGDGLYVIGGEDSDGNLLDVVERATIFADGTLGPFAPAGSLVAGRGGASAAVYGDAVYVVGGLGDGSERCEHADIVAGGPLVFRRDSCRLAARRAHAAAWQVGGALYLLGGEDDAGNALDTVERVELGGQGGVVGLTALPSPRSAAGLVRAGNTLHLVGGRGPAGPRRDVARIAIDATLQLTDFSSTPFTTQPGAGLMRDSAGVVVLGHYLYVIGGLRSEGQANMIPEATVLRANIQPDGMIDPFQGLTLSLNTARSSMTLAVLGSNLYVLGGDGGALLARFVERADILPSGRLLDQSKRDSKKFAAVGQVFQRASAGAAVMGPWLYLFGGRVPSIGFTDTIARVPIVDHTLVNITNAESVTPGLSVVRSGGALLALDRTIWFAAGKDASAPRTDIDRVDFDDLGGLLLPGAHLITTAGPPRNDCASIYISGRWFIVGGQTADTNASELVDSARIDASGPLEDFAQQSLSTARNGPAGVAIADWASVFGGRRAYNTEDTIEGAEIMSAPP